MASPGLNFFRIFASSTSMRSDSSSLLLALRRSDIKLFRPRACVDMVYDSMKYLLVMLCFIVGSCWVHLRKNLVMDILVLAFMVV